MKLFKRWRKDKKFRNNVIIGIIVFMFLSSSFPDTGTQAVTQEQCDAFNQDAFNKFIITQSGLSSCQASECNVQMNWNPDDWGLLGGIANYFDWLAGLVGVNTDMSSCKVKVETGKWLVASSNSEANNACASGNGVKVKDNWFTSDDVYQCVAGENGAVCKSWQKPIAGILDAVWKNNDIKNCSTKAYLTIGVGVAVLLAVI